MTQSRDKDGGWAWVVLCACSVCVMVTSGLAILAGLFQKIFMEEFDGGVVVTSWITSLYSSLLQLSGPVTGVVCSVFSCRTSVIAGSVLLTAGLLASSFCDNITTLLLAFGISSGLGMGLIYSAAIVTVNLSFVHYRPIATGTVLAAGGVGVMVMPVVCRVLLDAYSWWETLCVLSGVSAQLTVAGALLFPPTSAATAKRSTGSACNQNFLYCCCKRQQTTNSKPNTETRFRKSLPLVDSRKLSACANDSYPQTASETKENDADEDNPRVRNVQRPESSDVCGSEVTDQKSQIVIKCDPSSVSYFATRDAKDVAQGDADSLINSRAISTSDGDRPMYRENTGQQDHSSQKKDGAEEDGVAFLSSSKTRKFSWSAETSSKRTWYLFLKVLKNPSLIVICLQLFLANAAIGILLVHFAAFCMEKGSDFHIVSVSFSVNGLTLTISRFLLGSMAQDRNIDPLSVYVGLALVTSLIMALMPIVALTSALQIFIMASLGIYSGGSYALLTEVTIHCTGVDTLSLVFGLEMISAGLGFLVAPPIAGSLVVLTGSYSNAIFLAGFLNFVASGVAMMISLTRPVWKPVDTSAEVHQSSQDNYVISTADVQAA